MSAQEPNILALIDSIRRLVQEISGRSRRIQLYGAFGGSPFGTEPFGQGEVVVLPRFAPDARIRMESAITTSIARSTSLKPFLKALVLGMMA